MQGGQGDVDVWIHLNHFTNLFSAPISFAKGRWTARGRWKNTSICQQVAGFLLFLECSLHPWKLVWCSMTSHDVAWSSMHAKNDLMDRCGRNPEGKVWMLQGSGGLTVGNEACKDGGNLETLVWYMLNLSYSVVIVACILATGVGLEGACALSLSLCLFVSLSLSLCMNV